MRPNVSSPGPGSFLHSERGRIRRAFPRHTQYAATGRIFCNGHRELIHRRVQGFFLQINAHQVLFLVIRPGTNSPLADSFIDDQFSRAIFIWQSPQSVSARWNRSLAHDNSFLRYQECGFVSAGSPDFAIGNEFTPDFAHLAGARILCVRPPINNYDAISVNYLADSFMRTDAFLLPHYRR